MDDGQQTPGKSSAKVITYRNVPSDLQKHIDVFLMDGKPQVLRAAKKLDSATSLTDFIAVCKNHDLDMSGHLYTYFNSWFALLLTANKPLIFTVLAGKKAMIRQLLAFTLLPSSLRSGSWYIKWDGYKAKQDAAMSAVRHNMPRLLPMTEKQINDLPIKDTFKSRMRTLYGYK